MKKFFTSAFAALLMAAPVGNLSAQSAPMTKAEQDQVVKEVLPVVFNQIKEQAGIDILGWAKPQLTDNALSGFPVLETKSMLRAAEGKPVTAQPDSIIVNLGAINAQIGMFLGDAKVTFEGYDTKYLKLANKNVEINLPSDIIIRLTNLKPSEKNPNEDKVILSFDTKMEPGNLASLTMGIDMSIFGSEKIDLVDFAMAQGENYLIQAKLFVGAFLKELLKSDLDYLVNIDINALSESFFSKLPCSLKGIKPNPQAATDTIPMGDAELNLDLAALSQKGFPLKSINVTGYEKGQPNKWTQLAFGMTKDEKDPRDLTLTIDKSEFKDGFKGEGEYKQSTVFTMSDERALPTDVKSAAQTVVTRVVNELANEGKASWYKLAITQTKDNAKFEPVFDAEVTPYFSDDKKFAIADVDIKTYKDGAVVPMLVRAKAEIGGKNLITIQYQIAGKEIVTGYFTSNAAESILSNESVAVSNVKVIPTANGVRVLNAERANYSIYSITGALAGNGTISGDEVISTSNLAKGIYIIAVEANGVTQSIKFVR